MQPQPSAVLIVTDYELQQRLVVALEASTKLLELATEQMGNMRLYEDDAATYMGVEPKTMYHYRLRGLAYEKVGRIISYRRKDLDAWRLSGRVRKESSIS